MSKTQDSQPAATTPATTYETHLARVIAATSELAAEIEALQVAARATGRLAPKGLGPARTLHKAIVQARAAWKMIDPTLVGLPPVDQRAENIREAEQRLSLFERRLKWAKDLPSESMHMRERKALVDYWTQAVDLEKRRLALLKGEEVPPDVPGEDEVWNMAQRLGGSMRRAREVLGLDPGPERRAIPPMPQPE